MAGLLVIGSANANGAKPYKMDKSYLELVETIKGYHVNEYTNEQLNHLAMQGLVNNLQGESELIPVNAGADVEQDVESATAGLRLEQDVLLLKLPVFDQAVLTEFETVFDDNAAELEAVIFDVRGNHSHDLDAMLVVMNKFFSGGQLLLSKKGRAEGMTYDVYSEGGMVKTEAQVLVLVDADTSDVAEVFAAALKDYKKATIYGQPTKGMANQVSVLPLTKDYQVKLTTAFYYRPDGNRISGRAIQPDVLIDESELADFDIDILMRPFFNRG